MILRSRPLTTALTASATILVIYCLWVGLESGLARYLCSRAEARLADGDLVGGLALLEQAGGWDDAYARGQWLLACHSHARGDRGRTAAILAGLEERGQANLDSRDLLARTFEEGARPDDARKLYRKITALHAASIVGPLGLARLGDSALLKQRLTKLPDTAGNERRGLSFFHLDDLIGSHGYGTASAADSLLAARRVGANTIALRVPGRQARIDDPKIQFEEEPAGGETDEAVRRCIRDAHLLGFSVMLKPHIMLARITAEEWRGTIAFDTPKATASWWHDYRKFILYHAQLAAEENVATLCVGVELRQQVIRNPERWRRLIADVRKIYPGRLTYAANWHFEFAEVPFWDALDMIGVQFFFPLSSADHPTAESLRAGLVQPIGDLADLAFAYGKQVLFTEVGYKSAPGAAREPWVWPDPSAAPDYEIQAACYRTIFEAFQDRRWFAGMYWWNWLSLPESTRKFRHDFTPQGKPAEQVLRRYWVR